MINDKEDITEYNEDMILPPVDNELQEENINHFEDFDNSVTDIDFSQFKGKNFKRDFKKISKHIDKKVAKKKKPLSQNVPVERKAKIFGCEKKLGKVIVPRDRKVIIEGVNKFMLQGDGDDNAIRNIGYYKGQKLKKLILTFNNDSALDFNLELFNPSMPLDYLYSTSLNLNDKIQVAGGYVSYSDVLFNLLANPTMIVNAQFVASGPLATEQRDIAWQFKNKDIDGDVKIHPINLNLKIDNMQVFADTIYFDVMKSLNRPFIPDGMDVIQYKVLAGNTVTMCFYYKQISLKKYFFKEARESKKLM